MLPLNIVVKRFKHNSLFMIIILYYTFYTNNNDIIHCISAHAHCQHARQTMKFCFANCNTNISFKMQCALALKTNTGTKQFSLNVAKRFQHSPDCGGLPITCFHTYSRLVQTEGTFSCNLSLY